MLKNRNKKTFKIQLKYKLMKCDKRPQQQQRNWKILKTPKLQKNKKSQFKLLKHNNKKTLKNQLK